MIRNFSTYDEYNNFILQKQLHYVGSGSEGICYRSIQDNCAYKVLRIARKFDSKAIITANNYKSDIILFPEEIITVEKKIKAYKTKFIESNFFDSSEINIFEIDIDNLIEAYKKMKIELEYLSEAKIHTYDMPYNLLFDNQNIYAIDTIGYKKSDSEMTFIDNMENYDLAIEEVLRLMIKPIKSIVKSRRVMRYSVVEYLKYLKEIVEQLKNDKEKIYKI